MIVINGGSYRARGWWTKHLENAEKNDSVRILGMRGLDGCENIGAALRRMEEMALGTDASNFFYQANINPQPGEQLTEEQAHEAAERLKENLGLGGHPSMLIEHVKKGRTHYHVLASRIDSDGRLVRDSFTARVHEQTSRELEDRFGLERGQSVLNKDRDTPRPERRPKKWETIRALTTGITPQQVAAEVRELQSHSDNGPAFVNALDENGYIVFRGDQRVYCVLDRAGKDHSLARRLSMKAADLRDFMQDVPLENLPGAAEARALYIERKQQREQQRQSEQRKDSGTGDRWQRRYAALEVEAAEAAKAFYYDRDRQNQEWEAGLQNAAIAFAGQQEKDAAWQKLITPITRQEPEPKRQPYYAPELGKTDGEIRLAVQLIERVDDLPDALNDRKLQLARVVSPEADHQQLQQPAGAARGRYASLQPVQLTVAHDTSEPWMKFNGGYAQLSEDHRAGARQSWEKWIEQREKENPERKSYDLKNYVDYVQKRWKDKEPSIVDELAVVNEFGHAYRLNRRNTGKDNAALNEYLKDLDRSQLPIVEEAQKAAKAERDRARAEWIAAQKAERRAAHVTERSARIAHHETVRQIGQAYAETQTGPEFVAALEQRKILVSRASDEDAARAKLQRAYGLHAQSLAAGEYVAMNERGQMYKLDATTIHDEENNIMARLAQIDATTQMDVGTLRAWHEERKQDRLASEPVRVSDPIVEVQQTARGIVRKGAGIAGRTIDLTEEALDLGGSAARVAVQFIEGVLSGPSNAISGGSEEQKRHAAALAAARERARGLQQRPAEPLRAPANEHTPRQPAPSQERDALSEFLRRLRETRPRVQSEIKPEKERDKEPDRDR